MTAPTTPVARPSSTGRSGAGTNAAGEAGPSNPTSPACQVCGADAVPGDDVALCREHGGLAWPGFDEAAWLAGREAC